jgi:hypothetical protein
VNVGVYLGKNRTILKLVEAWSAPACGLQQYSGHSSAYKTQTEIIAAAIDGFEERKKRLNAQIAELRQMLNPSTTDRSAPTPVRRRMPLRPVPELRPLNG